MQKKLIVSPGPHLHNHAVSTQRIMLDVVIALLPTAAAAVWFFGGSALMLMIVAVISAIAAEYVYQKLTHQPVTVSDMSSVVTGLLLAFNLPANAPWWLAAVGSFLAIILIKQLFGGIGQNFMNPALAARAILMLSWTGLMAANVLPHAGQWVAPLAADAVSVATPLTHGAEGFTLWQLFSGDVPGMIGETSKLALLLGGVYLLIRKVIDWRIPVSFLGTVAIAYFIQTGTLYSVESGAHNVLYQLLSGGLIIGAFFMATDYVTSPITGIGKLIMGVGCGLFLFVIREFSSYPEGCSFAILFLNVLTPLIDRFTTKKPFGFEKPTAPAKEAKA
ncbi:MAG TPA: RnfABCDGE type electron transport complex subunit D [Candidatus Limiplasma sp.]|nr:RnfABCDGE type electron transport complex subunit D [Candidatus Limiplasma sp.]HRX09467.1 RnfABCDGE type electron transport complex subunit D [Candidatus Limiplasma sp.]